jgi:septal ring factor EnvC (AmiA/AmiB activator)
MDSSANTKQADPRDVSPGLSAQDVELVARADERLAHAYEQIASADEQLARINAQISRIEDDAARTKAVNKLRRPSRGRPALRGFIGLLLTAGICTAAFAWQSYGETVRPMISRWAPQLASSLPSATPELAAQQSLPVVQVAAADAAISQLSPPAQTVPQAAAPAPIPPEVTESLQTMARDLASVQQEIEQLKASQQELARENARTAEQLKASQEQIARVISNASEQNLRRTSAATSANPPPRVANPAGKPVSTLPPKQARAQVRAPVQLQSRQQ